MLPPAPAMPQSRGGTKVREAADLPHIDPALFAAPDPGQLFVPVRSSHPPRFLLLYGSVRPRSYSRLVTQEAAPFLVDRYSERKESAEALARRVQLGSI